MIAEFRANAGQISSGFFAGRQVLLLTTTGARSGQERLVPLVYTRDGDRIVIAASKGGAPTNPSWYFNLVANPVVTVELGAEKFQARATVIEGPERDRLYAAHGAYFPGFLEYEQRTTRKIPVIVLERLP
jgi:deazaflavin-dependent oxidoreductase (nitroreductase family)